MKTIFVSYNPKSDEEQTLAVRLHSIGAVHGFKMYLPDRYNSETYLDNETKNRIANSDWYIIFLNTRLSKIVKEEIEFAFDAFKDKSRIIVVYTKEKVLTGSLTEHFTEIYFNPAEDNSFDIVLQRIKEQLNAEKQAVKQHKKQKNEKNALFALLSVGLGLAALSFLFGGGRR